MSASNAPTLRPKRAQRTPQQLDPLGTYSVWLLPPIAGALAVAYALGSTLAHLDQITSAPFAVLGVVLVVAASALLIWRAVPRNAPLGRTAFIGTLALAVLGSLSFTASTWGANRVVQDDWGQIVAGVLLLAMSQLRPVRELVIAGLAVALVIGLAAAAQDPFLTFMVSPIIYALVAATPPVAMAFGAAAYARAMIRATVRWQDRARAGMAELEPQVRESVARSVQQEFVTTLNREAAPLLERILTDGLITTADSDAAAAIAAQLRAHALHAVAGTWLDDSVRRAGVDRVGMGPDAAAPAVLDAGVLGAVTGDQRAVFGALLMALTHASDFAVTGVSVTAVAGSRVAAREAGRVSRPGAGLSPSGGRVARNERIETRRPDLENGSPGLDTRARSSLATRPAGSTLPSRLAAACGASVVCPRATARTAAATSCREASFVR